jgi:hypothetical protein
MGEVEELIQRQAPPPGTYAAVIAEAEARLSKAGNSMLALTLQLTDPQWADVVVYDYIITDGGAKGAGIGKRKLRQIGHPSYLGALDTGGEIPDETIAAALVGTAVRLIAGNEQRMGRLDPDDNTSPYGRPMTIVNESGETVPWNRLTVIGYQSLAALAGTNPGATAAGKASAASFAVKALGTPAVYTPGAGADAGAVAGAGGFNPGFTPPGVGPGAWNQGAVPGAERQVAGAKKMRVDK